MKLAVLALPLLALAASAAASPAVTPGAPALPAAACINHGIANHALSTDRHAIYLLVHGQGTYRLDIRGTCLKTATRGDPVSVTAAGGSSKICEASEIALRVGPRPCAVDAIALLSPAEARALSKDERP